MKSVQVGQTLEATVTRVMPCRPGADPNDVVHAGDTLRVKIVGVDAERRRLSLSARLADGT